MADSPRPALVAARAQASLVLPVLLPGALTAYLAFNAGGYFPGEPVAVATLLLLVPARRVMLAPDPAAGLSRGLLLAAAALALFALRTLVSGAWSHAPARALIEFDRALLYLVALVLFGSLGGGVERLRWMVRGIALAAVVARAISLTTRLLPGVWPIAYESLTSRLNSPVTYWNALGLLAALGVILCFGMTASEREPRVVRVLTCAAIPLLGSTLLLTLSRGAMLVAIIGLIVFAVAGHPRGLLSGLVAAGPATVIAVVFAYDARLLVGDDALSRWHWEMAVVTLWLFAAGGAALARDGAGSGWGIPPLWQRGVIAGACCLIALLAPLRVAVSQDRLKASANRVPRRPVRHGGCLRTRLAARRRQPAAGLRGHGVLRARRRRAAAGGEADGAGRAPRSRQLAPALRPRVDAGDGRARPAPRRPRGAAPQPAGAADPRRGQALRRQAACGAVAPRRARDGDPAAGSVSAVSRRTRTGRAWGSGRRTCR